MGMGMGDGDGDFGGWGMGMGFWGRYVARRSPRHWADDGKLGIAAVEIARETGDARRDAVARVLAIGGKLYGVLSKLVR